MSQADLQRDVRSAISITYELLRHERILEREWIARTLGDLEDELARIEAKLGGPRRGEIVASSLDPWMERVEHVASEADPVVAGQIRALVRSLREIQRALGSAVAQGFPERVSASQMQAILDGVAGLGAIASMALARTASAKIASVTLGACALTVAAVCARQRGPEVLSAEAREAAGGALGAALVAAPFALGYAWEDPEVTAAHALAGLAALGGALAAAQRRARA
ncbi:MAG: hypothetical protein QM820_35945 [Minicystis sp.]